MSAVTGYQVKLWVGGGEWDPTTDQVFLGVYSAKNGGREFALNTEESLNQPGEEVTLFVGEQCCEDVKGLTVHNSLNWGWNGPKNHPILLDEIEHVYLRKFEGRSESADNYLVLNAAEVVACDGDGMRRWESKGYSGPLPFHRDVGLQHWLVETKPPMCVVTTTLRNVEHSVPGTASKPAGNNWKLSWGVRINNSPTSAKYTETTYFKDKNKNADAWTHWVQRDITHQVEGCCPKAVSIEVDVRAIELDRTFGGNFGGWFANKPFDINHDDEGFGSAATELECVAPSEDPQSLALVANCNVDPKSKARFSKLAWNFSVRAVCAD